MDPTNLPMPSLNPFLWIRVVVYTKLSAADRLTSLFGESFVARILAMSTPFVYPAIVRNQMYICIFV